MSEKYLPKLKAWSNETFSYWARLSIEAQPLARTVPSSRKTSDSQAFITSLHNQLIE